jgi:hypothetical protein
LPPSPKQSRRLFGEAEHRLESCHLLSRLLHGEPKAVRLGRSRRDRPELNQVLWSNNQAGSVLLEPVDRRSGRLREWILEDEKARQHIRVNEMTH